MDSVNGNQKTKIGLSLQKLTSFPMRYFLTSNQKGFHEIPVEPKFVTKRNHEHMVKVWGAASSSMVKLVILPPGTNMTRVIFDVRTSELIRTSQF